MHNRYFLTLVYLLISCLSSAQENFKPIDFGSKWQGYWFGNTDAGWVEYFTDNTLNDTIVNGESYNKLFYTSNPSDHSYFCGFRSDTIEKAIYILPKDSIHEYLFFDFDSIYNPYDTITIAHYNFDDFVLEQCVFLATDLVEINGTNYKNYYFSTSEDNIMTITERAIGLYCFPFQPGNFEWWTLVLRCYSEYNLPFYGICPYDYSDFHLGIKDMSTSSWLDPEIYPNPVKQYLHITQAEKSQMSIYDLTGRFIQSYYIRTNDYKIDLSELPANIYFVTLQSGEKWVTKKFRKQ